jgi:hypothetical protein
MSTSVQIASKGSKSKTFSNSAINTLNQTKKDNGLIDNWTSITDLMRKHPFHDTIRDIPINESLVSDSWKTIKLNPTASDYYSLQQNKWLEKEVLSNTNLDCVNSNDPWINIEDMQLKSFGGNRLQLDNLAGPTGLFRRAFDWNRHLLTYSLVQWCQKGTIHKEVYVADSGGTFCAAALRGIESVQAQTTLIHADTREEFEAEFDKLYDGINTPRKRLSEWEKHVDKLAQGDKESIELEDLSRACNVTFNPNSPAVYNYIKLPPVKAILDWQVYENNPATQKNTFIEYIAGDHKKYAKQILKLMNKVWPGTIDNPTTHNASIFKLLVAMMGTLNGHVQLSEVEDFLIQIKNGLEIKNTEVNNDPNKDIKVLDATTSNTLAESINLGGYAPQDVRFAMVGVRLWNSVCRVNELIGEEVSENFVEYILKRFGKAIRFDSKRVY